jgi:hypothetical protein
MSVISKSRKWFLAFALVSIPLGFLLSMFGYGYPFPTPGMYIATRLMKSPPSAEWSIFGENVLVGMAVDASA